MAGLWQKIPGVFEWLRDPHIVKVGHMTGAKGMKGLKGAKGSLAAALFIGRLRLRAMDRAGRRRRTTG